MTAWIPPLAMGIISVVVGLQHLAIYARTRRSREHLAFGLLALTIALYCAAAAGLYAADSPERGRSWLMWQSVAMAAGAPALLWFVAEHTRASRRWPVRALALGNAALMLAALAGGSDLLWTHVPSVKRVVFPLGFALTYNEVVPGVLQIGLEILSLVMFVGVFSAVAEQYRRGERRRAVGLGAALAVFFLAALNDALVAGAVIPSLYLLEYAFVGLVLVMGDSLVADLVAAAGREAVERERTAELGMALETLHAEVADRHRAEEALRESEAKYRSLFEDASVGVYRTTVEGQWLAANPTLARILGFESPEELMRATSDLNRQFYVDPTVRQEFIRRLQHDDSVVEFESQVETKDGRLIWISENTRAVRDAGGKLVGFEGTTIDITARRQAENALRESEARYRALADEALVGVYVIQDGRFAYVNPQLAKTFGYPPEEVIGRLGPRDLTAVDDRGAVAEHIRRRVDGEVATVHYEFRGLRKDGSLLDCEALGARTELAGRPAIIGTLLDITDRKRAEAENRLLAHALRSVSQCVSVTDTEDRILFVNRAFEETYGYPEEELVGKPISVVRSPHTPSANASTILPATLAGGWQGQVINRRKNGEDFPVALSTSVVRDEGGNAVALIGVATDMTEHNRLEEQLRQAQKMEAVGLLAGGVAHDFNNVLQAMLSHVQLLRNASTSTERALAVAQELEQQVLRGASLTRQLLLFSRRESAKPEPLDLNEVVHGAVRMLRRLVRENVAFEVELAPARLPVRADRGQLEQVLMNLVVNASDAMPEGGALTIRTGAEGHERVWLAVEDTGHGIPEELVGRIFEPFFTTKKAERGTGLGLSVVHGIVSQHRGRIEVESASGRGSTFRVSLPCAASDERDVAGGSGLAVSDLPFGKGERLLVVEDEVAARDGLRDILASLGYEVTALADGEQAGRLPDRPAFDLLLTDLMLPGVAGQQLARGLRERWPRLKVILMSGYTDDAAVRRGIAAGAVRFLQKPFDMATLARELRAALDE